MSGFLKTERFKILPFNITNRIVRHLSLMRKGIDRYRPSTPPFLTLFITSVCNLSCDHCFNWQNLNRNDDLTFDEIKSLSKDMGVIENLNLSGGEPFLRTEFSEICRLFISNNKVKQIYVPTNAYFTDKMYHQIKNVLKESALDLLVIEISLDGMPGYHNKLRGNGKSFQNAMESYKMLEELNQNDKRLRIHADSTASSENISEIRELSKFLYKQCPSMDHHGIAVIRGEWKGKKLGKPQLKDYRDLHEYVQTLWGDREKKRFGAIVEPLLQWAKCKVIMKQQQVIPCLAGVLSAVVYANGDIGVCELLGPLGNLRENRFFEIWNSPEAKRLRHHIKSKKCYCTHEISLWPSIVFQPFQLMKAMLGARVWRKLL